MPRYISLGGGSLHQPPPPGGSRPLISPEVAFFPLPVCSWTGWQWMLGGRRGRWNTNTPPFSKRYRLAGRPRRTDSLQGPSQGGCRPPLLAGGTGCWSHAQPLLMQQPLCPATTSFSTLSLLLLPPPCIPVTRLERWLLGAGSLQLSPGCRGVLCLPLGPLLGWGVATTESQGWRSAGATVTHGWLVCTPGAF